MANPDSVTTIVRRWLSKKLDVMPPPGIAWCIGCRLYDGKTAVMDSDLRILELHAEVHTMDNSKDRMTLVATRKDVRA